MKIKSFLTLPSVFVLIFSLYSLHSLQRLYLYELEILIDSKGHKTNAVSATTFIENGSTAVLTGLGKGVFSGQVVTSPGALTSLKVDLNTENGRIDKAWIGDRQVENSKIIHNSDLLGPNWGPDTYYNYEIIKAGANSERAPPYWIFAGLTIWVLFVFFNQEKESKVGPIILREIVFSGSIFKYLSSKDYILIALTFICSTFVTVGCDAASMLNIIIQFYSGVDIYQFQVGHKLLLKYEFINWPYNPFFLIFYSFFSAPWAKIFINSDPVLGFQHIQTLGLKATNFVLVLSTSLSIISFAIDSGYLKNKIRASFYLCFLNPVIFYVAIIFLQLDIAPLYLITVGLLSLSKNKINIFNSALLLGLGLSCKLQNLLLLGPILLASFLVFMFAESGLKVSRRLFRFLSHSGIVLLILIALTKPFQNPTQAFYHLLTNFSQTDRLWSTVIIYAHGGLFIYMTLLVIVLLSIIHCSYFHSKLSKSEIISNIFLMMGMIILSFSFAHMNTPSTLIQAGSGLFMLSIFRKDTFQKTFLYAASILMLFNVLFSDVGDITRIFGWGDAYFTNFYRTMPHEDKVKYSSVLFSIANSTMLAYSILMLKESIGRLKANRESE